MEHDQLTSTHYSTFSDTIWVKQVDTQVHEHSSLEILVLDLLLPSNHFSTFYARQSQITKTMRCRTILCSISIEFVPRKVANSIGFLREKDIEMLNSLCLLLYNESDGKEERKEWNGERQDWNFDRKTKNWHKARERHTNKKERENDEGREEEGEEEVLVGVIEKKEGKIWKTQSA